MNNLIKSFEICKKTESFSEHNKFIKDLLEKDDKKTLEIHIKFITNHENKTLHNRLCRAFAKRNKYASEYLLEKVLENKENVNLIVDAIQILGLMKYKEILLYIPQLLEMKNELIKYKCIIVMGWLGGVKEIHILDKIINSSTEPDYLRGLSATAMRQINFNHPELKKMIESKLYNAIKNENNNLVIAMIIITLQDICKVKFGLTENNMGEIKGNIEQAKTKCLYYLN